jgi:tRNA-splicing ligase RtcB
MDMERENSYLLRAPREGRMKVDAWIYAKKGIRVEESAVEQLKDAASLPSVTHALGMPDIHHGYGVPIGSVVATREVIVPAAVGYDINCGMRLLTTSLYTAEVDLKELSQSVSRDIPLGEGKNNVPFKKADFEAVLAGGLSALVGLLERLEDRGSMEGDPAAAPARALERGVNQLATLGGGNHFIEFQHVEKIFDPSLAERLGLFKGQLAIMVHSGSRGFGHEVGGHYMKMAKEHNRKHGADGPSPSLSYLPADAKQGRSYIGAMRAAANFAFANRALMAALVAGNVKARYPEAGIRLVYDVPHNMAKLESHGGDFLWVHRKGSTRAFDGRGMAGTLFADLGQPVLIPGSMGTASYVLVGVDSGEKSLYSVNHGAGRAMSRTRAAGRRRGRKGRREAAISDEDFKRSMEGIHLIAADRRSVKEEAPAAYKDIDAVIDTVIEAGLALPVARLKPGAVLKG